MKIYTKTGDDGTTGLWGGRRVPKTHPRCEAYGTLDELAATLGMARALLDAWITDAGMQAGDKPDPGSLRTAPLDHILADLFTFGSAIAGATEAIPGHPLTLTRADVERLEGWIDESEAGLEPLKNFVLATGTPLAAALHMARTICRRAERRVLAVDAREEPIAGREDGLQYLNRLSDLCFSWARLANAMAGKPDLPWTPREA